MSYFTVPLCDMNHISKDPDSTIDMASKILSITSPRGHPCLFIGLSSVPIFPIHDICLSWAIVTVQIPWRKANAKSTLWFRVILGFQEPLHLKMAMACSKWCRHAGGTGLTLSGDSFRLWFERAACRARWDSSYPLVSAVTIRAEGLSVAEADAVAAEVVSAWRANTRSW